MTERSLIQSHLCPAAHNRSTLKFTALAFEWDSNMLDGHLAHFCSIKAIRYDGPRLGERVTCRGVIRNGVFVHIPGTWSSTEAPNAVICCLWFCRLSMESVGTLNDSMQKHRWMLNECHKWKGAQGISQRFRFKSFFSYCTKWWRHNWLRENTFW